MITYEKLEIPDNYFCAKCKAKGIKLWRQYNTFVSHLELLCAKCAAPSKEVDQDGHSVSSIMDDVRTDQLEDEVGKTGSLVPAVPTLEGDTYWGYSSVPVAGCAWWRALPVKVGDKARSFYIDPKDLALEQKMLEDKKRFEAKPEQYKRETTYLVEATNFEQHALWCEWADEASVQSRLCESRRMLMGSGPNPPEADKLIRKFDGDSRRWNISSPGYIRDLTRVKWEQLSPGSCVTVGTDNKRPIVVTCFWVRLNGKTIMFYEPTSRLVDWKKVEEWLEKEYPGIPKTNAMNFVHCLHDRK